MTLLDHSAPDNGKTELTLTESQFPAAGQKVLARRLGLNFIDLKLEDIDAKVLDLIPAELALQHCLIPIKRYEKDGNHHLLVAMSNPLDQEAIGLLGFITGRHIDIVVADEQKILTIISDHYKPSVDPAELDDLVAVQAEEYDTDAQQIELERLSKQKPLVRLVDNIIRDAIRRRASDVHLRPEENEIALIYRIDGNLVPMRKFNKALLPVMVSRIKVMGGMDIATKRRPQDGQARVREPDNTIDLRLSVLPTVNGESVVIRILNTKAGLRNIDEIGFSVADKQQFLSMLSRSNGLILVTGPTGSGKSTTLYGALQEIIKQNINIITIEDPVEYHVAKIQQVQVNRAAGLTFAQTLRNILRHDPDAIMIGEIRDQETAQIALESALTGHLVLSTLHTNSAAKTITRLLDMGSDPLLVNATLMGVIAQRLVRRNCPHCLQEERVDPYIRTTLNANRNEVFYRGAGCAECNNLGYRGRMATYELLVATPRIRDLIMRNASSDEIFEQALVDGMLPLTEHALHLARERRTSLSEVYRVRQE